MKKLAAVLVTLGIVAVVVACCPGLAGIEKPAPGFGPHQMIALAIGLILVIVGLAICKCKCSCSCDTGADAEPEDDETADTPEAASPEEQSSE